MDKRAKLLNFMRKSLPNELIPDTDMTLSTALATLEAVAPAAMPEALQALGAVESPKAKTKFRCPVLQETLTTACQARSCRYWTDYATADNCLLAYMDHHQQDSLSLTEISYLTGLTLTTVSRLHTAGLLQLRQRVVDGVFVFDDLEQEFVLIPNAHACVSCEAIMSPADAHHVDSTGFHWCSPECLEERTPDDVRIEHRFGVQAQRVLRFLSYKIMGTLGTKNEPTDNDSKSKYVYDSTSLSVLAQTLGLTTAATEAALQRHNLWREKQAKTTAASRTWTVTGNKRNVKKLLGFSASDHRQLLNTLLTTTPGLDDAATANLTTVCDQVVRELRLA